MIGKRIGYIVYTTIRLAVKAIIVVIRFIFGLISLFLSLFLIIFRVFLIFLVAGKYE